MAPSRWCPASPGRRRAGGGPARSTARSGRPRTGRTRPAGRSRRPAGDVPLIALTDTSEQPGHQGEQGVADHGGRQQADHHQRGRQQQRQRASQPAMASPSAPAVLRNPPPRSGGDQRLEHRLSQCRPPRSRRGRDQRQIDRRRQGEPSRARTRGRGPCPGSKTPAFLTAAGHGVGQPPRRRPAARAALGGEGLGRADRAGGRERGEHGCQQGMASQAMANNGCVFPIIAWTIHSSVARSTPWRNRRSAVLGSPLARSSPRRRRSRPPAPPPPAAEQVGVGFQPPWAASPTPIG